MDDETLVNLKETLEEAASTAENDDTIHSVKNALQILQYEVEDRDLLEDQ